VRFGIRFFDVSVLTAYSKPLFSDISLQHSCLGISHWHLALAYLALAYLALAYLALFALLFWLSAALWSIIEI
jgi:hypothetical protein